MSHKNHLFSPTFFLRLEVRTYLYVRAFPFLTREYPSLSWGVFSRVYILPVNKPELPASFAVRRLRGCLPT